MTHNVSIRNATGQSDSHIEWLSENCGINRDIVPDWLAMQSAALQAGIDLRIASGFRSFERQLSIWNRKFRGELNVKNAENEIVDMTCLSEQEKIYAILLYSVLPGASRHHWGTDIDVYSPNLLPSGSSLKLEPWEYQENGYFHTLSIWLTKHAKDFGFYFPYQEFSGGVAAEPWHLSHQHFADKMSVILTEQGLRQVIKNSEIEGKDAILSNLTAIMVSHIKI